MSFAKEKTRNTKLNTTRNNPHYSMSSSNNSTTKPGRKPAANGSTSRPHGVTFSDSNPSDKPRWSNNSKDVSRNRYGGGQGRVGGGTVAVYPEHEEETAAGGPAMSPVRQATLIHYHSAIEDNVDIDNVWDEMHDYFDDEEQEDIQTAGGKKQEIRRMLDLMPAKDDEAFDALVKALDPDYRWLANQLRQGVRDEEVRVHKMGKGIRRKIALALLTARISERQKHGILNRVAVAVETEMQQKALRVSIPDHRAAQQLEEEHRRLHELIKQEVDPLLYGDDGSSTARDDDDADDMVEVLGRKLQDLQAFRDCYLALDVGPSSSGTLPAVLLEKIEEVKTRIQVLHDEKTEVLEDIERLNEERDEVQRALNKLEQINRNLEMENRTLEQERQWMEQSAMQNLDEKREVERDLARSVEERRDLRAELQILSDKASSLNVRARTLDTENLKLTRDNVKFSAANAKMRAESKRTGAHVIAGLRTENQHLDKERIMLRREIGYMENDKRHLVVRIQKLEADNGHLREQKGRLLHEKKNNTEENRALKIEAKRLALGKYSPLPPITERGEGDKEDQEVASLTSRSTVNATTNAGRRSRSLGRRSNNSSPTRTHYSRSPRPRADQYSPRRVDNYPPRRTDKSLDRNRDKSQDRNKYDEKKGGGSGNTTAMWNKNDGKKSPTTSTTSQRGRAAARGRGGGNNGNSNSNNNRDDEISYADDMRSYMEDNRSYREDARSYKEDARSYKDDARSYNDDARSYNDDARSYNDDAKSYREETYTKGSETYRGGRSDNKSTAAAASKAKTHTSPDRGGKSSSDDKYSRGGGDKRGSVTTTTSKPYLSRTKGDAEPTSTATRDADSKRNDNGKSTTTSGGGSSSKPANSSTNNNSSDRRREGETDKNRSSNSRTTLTKGKAYMDRIMEAESSGNGKKAGGGGKTATTTTTTSNSSNNKEKSSKEVKEADEKAKDRKPPRYLQNTSSSKKHTYLEDEPPKRSSAFK